MSSLSAHDLSAIRTALTHEYYRSFAQVAPLTILLYDVFITFDLEIEYIWKSPWSYSKVLYIVTRYLIFIDVGISATSATFPSPSEHTCSQLYTITSWIYVVGIASGQAILSLRAWAFCQRRKTVLIILLVTWVVIFGVELLSAWYQTVAYEFTIQNVIMKLNRSGCVLTSGRSTLVLVNLAILLAYDAALTLVMVIPAYQSFQSGIKSRILSVAFKDGILYYMCLFVVTLADLLVVTILSPDYFCTILMLERVVRSVLACRVLLHIRQEAQQSIYYSTSTMSISFA